VTPPRKAKPRGIPRIYTFTVLGEGPFPVDMLRYDLCYPKSQSDSGEIERSYKRSLRDEHRVTLVSSKHPTEERWGSFGWLLESVE
jgi:hypothetical protein